MYALRRLGQGLLSLLVVSIAIWSLMAFTPGDRPQSVAAWRALVVAGAVDSEAATVAVAADATSTAGVDFVLDGADDTPAPSTGTRTDSSAPFSSTTAGPTRA